MDISKITDYLYVSSKLQAGHIEELPMRNISMAISMIARYPPPDHPSFHILWLRTCDSIFTPIPMKDLMAGVQAALPVIQNGQGILVYCAEGRHRSIAMASAILIAMGHTAREAMGLLRAQRPIADPQAWHISRRIRKFERQWNNRSSQTTGIIDRIDEAYAVISTRFTSYILLCLTGLHQWLPGKPHFQSRQKGNDETAITQKVGREDSHGANKVK